MKVLVDFKFVFEPQETWGNITMFENDLASFFRAKGLTADIVNCGDTEPNKRMIILSKNTEVTVSPPVTSDKSIKQVKADLIRGRGYDGKFTK